MVVYMETRELRFKESGQLGRSRLLYWSRVTIRATKKTVDAISAANSQRQIETAITLLVCRADPSSASFGVGSRGITISCSVVSTSPIGRAFCLKLRSICNCRVLWSMSGKEVGIPTKSAIDVNGQSRRERSRQRIGIKLIEVGFIEKLS